MRAGCRASSRSSSIELKPEPREGGKAAAAPARSRRCAHRRGMPRRARRRARRARQPWTTRMLADNLARWRDESRDVAFVIGSADGLADSIRRNAQAVVALSAMTLPHGLVRVLVAEQLYRAVSAFLPGTRIIANESRRRDRQGRNAAMNPAIYLASKSPRRQELLRQLGIDFDRVPAARGRGPRARRARSPREGEPAQQYVERIARTKAAIALASDAASGGCRRGRCSVPTPRSRSTESIFGKPADAADAAACCAAVGPHARGADRRRGALGRAVRDCEYRRRR